LGKERAWVLAVVLSLPLIAFIPFKADIICHYADGLWQLQAAFVSFDSNSIIILIYPFNLVANRWYLLYSPLM